MSEWGGEGEEKRDKKREKKKLELLALCVNLYSGIGIRRKSLGTSFCCMAW